MKHFSCEFFTMLYITRGRRCSLDSFTLGCKKFAALDNENEELELVCVVRHWSCETVYGKLNKLVFERRGTLCWYLSCKTN